MLVGICMIAYPFVSDYLNRLEQAKVTRNLTQTIAEMPAEDLSAYMQQAQSYNDRLLSGSTYVVDPFDPNASAVTNQEYLDCLNLNGDGVMGQIVLPDDTSSLAVREGRDLVTLVTCTPYGVNSHRLLVHAERCEVPEDWLDRKAAGDVALPFPYGAVEQSVSPFAIGLFVAAGIIIIVLIIRSVRRRRESEE